MIKSMVLAAIAFCLSTNIANAWEYASGDAQQVSSLSQVETIQFGFDTLLELDLLFGEPVINARMRWLIDPSQSLAEIPSLGPGEDRYITVPLYDLGADAYNKIRLFNVVLQFQFSSANGQTLYLAQDAGDLAIGDGETWSFNVSGSPNWAEVFYRNPLTSHDGERSHFPENISKQAFVEQLTLEDVTILSAEVSFFDLHNWYAENSPEAEAVAFEGALRTIATGIEEGFGLEIDIEAEVSYELPYLDPLASGNRIKEFEARVAHLKRRIDRLSSLPPAILETGNADVYFDAMQAAGEIVERSVHFNFDSPDRDPATFRQGVAAQSGNSNILQPHVLVVAPGPKGLDYLDITHPNGEPYGRFHFDSSTNDGNFLSKRYYTQVDGVMFDENFIRLSNGYDEFLLINQSGAIIRGEEGGQFTSDYAIIAIEEPGGDHRLKLIDRDFNSSWEWHQYGTSIYHIHGFFEGWARAEMFNHYHVSGDIAGDVLISESGEVISARELGFDRIVLMNDFSFGDIYMLGMTNGRFAEFMLRPDLSTYPVPDRQVRLIPGGLAEVCGSPKQYSAENGWPSCEGVSHVFNASTGEVIISGDNPDYYFITAIYQDRYVIMRREFARYHLDRIWDLTGEPIINPDPNSLVFGDSSNPNCPQC